MTACRSLDPDSLMAAVEEMRRQGHSARQFLVQLYEPLMNHDELIDFQKAVIFEKMAVSICEKSFIFLDL